MKNIITKSFIRRTISALVLGPLVLAVIWHGGWLFALFVILCAAVCIYEWLQLSLEIQKGLLLSVAGVLYILFAFWCCYWIRAAHMPVVSMLFIALVWSSDIGAYITGKYIEGPKMAPQISPGKTWAGFAGALIFPVIAGGLVVLAWGNMPTIENLIWLLVGCAVIIGAVCQAGDLMVSFLKRRAGAKDSGQLIPGHGGLLDRVDAMMLAAPVFLFFVREFASGLFS